MNRLMKQTIFLVLFLFSLMVTGCTPKEKQMNPDVLQAFLASAFSSELEDSSRNFFIRWEEPIRIQLKGAYTKADKEHLFDFLATLQEQVPSLPPLSVVETEGNVPLYFVSSLVMPLFLPA